MKVFAIAGLCFAPMGFACSANDGFVIDGAVPAVLVEHDARRTVVVYASEEHREELLTIANGATPREFAWLAIEVPSPTDDSLSLPEGLSVDMSRPDPAVVFTQVYADACNPALDDFSPCWLLERYTAGDEGLSGSIWLRLMDGVAEARVHVSWQGITDRFGPPDQWHSHETSAGGYASIGDTP